MYIYVHDLEPLNHYLDHRFLGSGRRLRWKSSMKELFLNLKMKIGQACFPWLYLSVSKWPARPALPWDPSRGHSGLWAFGASADIGSNCTILNRNSSSTFGPIWASASGLSVSPLPSFLSVHGSATTDSVLLSYKWPLLWEFSLHFTAVCLPQ